MPGDARVAGALLAGGRASRFGGRAKGLETVGGRRVIDRVAEALGAACDRMFVVANAPDAAGWLPGVPAVADVRPGLGPLGGIHAALSHAGGSTVVVAAWDMPFVSAALLGRLRDEVVAGAAAAVPLGAARRPEPLCACYGPGCLAVAERLLDAGERRAAALAEAVGAFTLGEGEVAAFGDPARLFLSINTPDDLAGAERLALDTPPSRSVDSN